MSDAPPATQPGTDPAEPGTGPATLGRWRRAVAGTHLVVSFLAGVVAGAAVVPIGGPGTAALIAWVVAATVFLVWIWAAVRRLPAADTAWLAQREDGSRGIRDLVLIGISVGTLLAVAVVIFRAHHDVPQLTLLGVVSVAASWLVLNTVFALRYARLFYTEPRGGVDFNQDADPTYRDFAYLAFTIGMTFQVSDTSIGRPEIRTTTLRHALTSFVFDAVIIAITVNVVAGLST